MFAPPAAARAATSMSTQGDSCARALKPQLSQRIYVTRSGTCSQSDLAQTPHEIRGEKEATLVGTPQLITNAHRSVADRRVQCTENLPQRCRNQLRMQWRKQLQISAQRGHQVMRSQKRFRKPTEP